MEHHITKFFARFPNFHYHSVQPIHKEFFRLAKKQGWNETRRKAEREALKDAMVMQFNQMYGRDEDDLGSWQQLCGALGVDSIPNKIAECRMEVTGTHVNLVDFIHMPDPEKPVKTFRTEVELSLYTKRTGKYFPRKNVNAGSLLKCLLRHIDNPSKDRGAGLRSRGGIHSTRGRRGRERAAPY